MDILSKKDLVDLSLVDDGWHVSIFMPTHRAGPETQQDPICLKNLLVLARERLQAVGLRLPEAEARLEPVSRLLQDSPFWRHQGDGLAVFVSGELFRHYRLPLSVEEQVVVAKGFHVKPLLPLLSGDGRFYLLALSQDEVRLFQGTRYRIAEIDLEEAPASKAEALRYDDPERRLQFHTASGPSGGEGSRPAMFHGHGAPSQDQKDGILRYFHKLDTGLQAVLAGEQAPMVLAGVDYLLPLYRRASSYPNLLEEGITGSPENLDAGELHQKAWPLVQPHFQEERASAARRLAQSAGGTGMSDRTVEIVPAAFQGRVDTLFVALDVEQWGTFEPGTHQLSLHDTPQPGDSDLADLAAVQTLIHGGAVYALKLEEMPVDASAVALFRY
jgi:hypothetical protein